MYKHPLIDRDKMAPSEALKILKEGNHRFINNLRMNNDYPALLENTKNQQHPFASILSCSDSRAPVELIFDQAIGDIFSVRLAGNIASTDAIGSLEFGLKYLKSKLLVVLGHTSCGAVKACCDNFEDASITDVVAKITPCLDLEKTTKDQRSSTNMEFVQKVSDLNVKYQMKEILEKSEIISKLYEKNQISIIGGMYNLENGEVNFFES